MRPVATLVAAVCLALGCLPAARAADLRFFDDAALHAVQFLDDEGWAVGDDGVVWHSMDGGKSWERQPTGIRASLRSLHFLTPLHGWVAGREELPGGAGSVGVLLATQDGGFHWKRVLVNTLPGLNVVRFLDAKTGFLAGDGSDQHPSGVFMTTDGTTWQPVPGPRAPSWLAAQFEKGEPEQQQGPTGTLAGSWNRMAHLRNGKISLGENDELGGRDLRGLYRAGKRGVAVGQGGLVLANDGGGSWDFVDLKLPGEVLSGWDLHAVHGSGTHLWALGRPGSVVLHSPDLGRTWEVQRTGHPLPLNGVYFRDASHGWAVGEFGTILGTGDGGKTWKLQRRGGQRAAALFVHARAGGLPADTVALLGAGQGYLTVGLRVTGADPAGAAPGRATEAARFGVAVRQAGGAAAESLWQFPVSALAARGDRAEILRAWDRLHGDRAAEQLLRQLVLAVRLWRPDVVITDNPDPKGSAFAGDALLAEATREAFERAADPKQFPEQLAALGLGAWKPSKLYGRWEGRTDAHVLLDLTAARAPLQASVRDFAAGPAGLLAEGAAVVPAQRAYRLLAEHLDGAADHKELMQGLDLTPGGPARRVVPEAQEPDADLVKVVRQRALLHALVEAPPGELTDPNKLLGRLGAMTAELPDDHGAAALLGAAGQYARAGQWELARETYRLLAERYPTHPLSIEAYRWLIRHNSSSEARRRHELGQFILLTRREYGVINADGDGVRRPPTSPLPGVETRTGKPGDQPKLPQVKAPVTEMHQHQDLSLLGSSDAAIRKWYQGCLDLEPRLTAFGPLVANDPTIQFPLQAARRHLGDFEAAKNWYSAFASRQPDGPWRNAALAELWLMNRTGTPPKPVAVCRQTDVKPYLDGKLDDPCWQPGQPLRLRDAAAYTSDGKLKPPSGAANPESELEARYPTEVRLAYDRDYLYVAVRCKHPEGKQVPPAKSRKHDDDLHACDRVSLLFDLDRDYATCFHLQVDQRGCVSDDCWGDKTWNPRWFVSVHGEATEWVVEAAIPLIEFTAEPVTHGKAWAFNVVRTTPGVGVQGWSLPAEATEEAPRPEGMGLLMFLQEPARQAATANAAAMPPAR